MSLVRVGLTLPGLFFSAQTVRGDAIHATMIVDIDEVANPDGAQEDAFDATVTVSIDPSITNWIAWHNLPTPTEFGGVDYVGWFAWIGVNTHFHLTVTNPAGESSTEVMSNNDGWGQCDGPQGVIYGTAEESPDVARWGAGFTPDPYPKWPNIKVFDEEGAFNDIFTTAGTYTFRFSTQGDTADHGDIYLLVSESPGSGVIPEPSTVATLGGLLGMGLIGCWWKRRRKS
jgi:hypothetical protein